MSVLNFVKNDPVFLEFKCEDWKKNRQICKLCEEYVKDDEHKTEDEREDNE
jgi:hypothetical protein